MTTVTIKRLPAMVKSYCENGTCQVRGFEFFIKPYDGPETVKASKIFCPLCGERTSRWLRKDTL